MGIPKQGPPSWDMFVNYDLNCWSRECIITSWNTYEIITIFGLPEEAKWRIFVTR